MADLQKQNILHTIKASAIPLISERGASKSEYHIIYHVSYCISIYRKFFINLQYSI